MDTVSWLAREREASEIYKHSFIQSTPPFMKIILIFSRKDKWTGGKMGVTNNNDELQKDW
jgi:hypothetical protein